MRIIRSRFDIYFNPSIEIFVNRQAMFASFVKLQAKLQS